MVSLLRKHSALAFKVFNISLGNLTNVWNTFLRKSLTLSRRRPLSYRNQSIDWSSLSMDWFLYDNGLHLEKVKSCHKHCEAQTEDALPRNLLKNVNSFIDNEIMSNQNYFTHTEAVARCSVKKVFFEISQNWQENTRARVFLRKLKA